MLDVTIGRHTWNCQIRTHIDTEIHTYTHTHQKKKKEKERKGGEEQKRKGKKKEGGGGFREVEERGYCGRLDLILITLDRHECFSVFVICKRTNNANNATH